MANVHALPGDEYLVERFYDSSMPGAFLFQAERALDPLSKDGVHPFVAQNVLAGEAWALHGRGMPRERAQYYAAHEERKMLYGQHDGGRVGREYFGPRGEPVIALAIRPKGATSGRGPARDN